MKLSINELALIRDSTYEDAQFTLIAGDNGTGKTIFLETLVVVKNSIDKIINRIIKSLEYEFQSIGFKVYGDLWENLFADIKKEQQENDEEESYHINFKKGFRVELMFNYTAEIEKLINDQLDIINKVLNNEIIENVFGANDFFENMDSELKERYLNYNKFSNKVDVHLSSVPPIQSKLYTADFSYFVSDTHLICSVKIDDYERRYVLDLVKEIGYGFNKEIFDDGKDLNLSKVLFSRDEIKNDIEKSVKTRLIEYLFKDYLFKGVQFFPSERVSNMDTALRSLLDGDLDNGSIRYSEILFNKKYLEHKDLVSRFKLPRRGGYKSLRNLIGGNYIVDGTGEIIGLEQNNGTIIPRKLFSTKQIRMIPYQMLETSITPFELVIIEEPEAHLSMESLKSLIPFFRQIMDSGKQLIISTHSEILVQLLNNSILLDDKINSKVYEMHVENDLSKLNEVEKSTFGYSIDLMNRNLEQLFTESNKVHQNLEGDFDD